MKCPHCKQKTIRFVQWKHAMNAFDWQCPHCSAVLRANWFVYATFWSAIVLSIGAATAMLIWRGPEEDIVTFVLCFLVPWSIILPLGAVSWFFGGYRLLYIPEFVDSEEDSFQETSTQNSEEGGVANRLPAPIRNDPFDYNP